MKKLVFIALVFCSLLGKAQGDSSLIQFSGFAMTADSLMGISYAHVTILGTNRVATAGLDGFFSFAAHKGDTLYFTCVGFRPAIYRIPKNLPGDKYSVIQLLTKSEHYLPTVIVYPWGDKANFPEYFKNLKLPKSDEERAEENTNRQLLAALGEKLPIDGNEATENYLRAQAVKTYYYGQSAPSGLGSPLAWAEFIRAWKRGDFKKKEKYVPESH